MLVKDVMTYNVVTVKADDSVMTAKELMTKNNVDSLPVVDKNETLCGIITKSDLKKVSPSEATSLDVYEIGYLLSNLKVEKAMIRSVKTARSVETIEDAARLMMDYNISSLPVVDDDVLTGIITKGDLFRCFMDMFSTKFSGVRAMVEVVEKPGVLQEISKAVADKGCNIISLVTSESKDNSKKILTIKIADISVDDAKQILSSYGAISDIRNV